MAYYKSLREYLEAVDKAGKLVTIKSPINKDTQLTPLLSLQDRGLSEEQRKVFLFTNVFDSRGKKYDIPVAIGMDAVRQPSPLGLQCPPEEIPERLAQAYMHPIEPRLVEEGPVQEVVHMGDGLLEHGGLDEFPVPITYPGWDGGAITSQSCWVSKDIKTGIRNVGMYRSQLYSPTRMGIHLQGPEQGLTIHWQQRRATGIPLQVAIVFGGPPVLSQVATNKFPCDVDEYGMAGAITGEPVKLVKCKTVDLEAPANADIVIEGELTTDELEMEGPHGEVTGHVSMQEMQPYLTVKCITHRKNPIWPATVPGVPIGWRGQQVVLYKYLKYDLNIPQVLAVSTVCGLTVIKMKMNTDQEEVWRALEAAHRYSSGRRVKMIIAVDEDIDVQDIDLVLWALDSRVEPHRDCRISKYVMTDSKHGSVLPQPEMMRVRHHQFDQPLPESSRMLINATLKFAYPPVNLPRREFMEEALRIWQKEGLPPLKLRQPWYGYELGYWPKEAAEDAERAVKGEYYQTSEIRAKNRVKLTCSGPYPRVAIQKKPSA